MLSFTDEELETYFRMQAEAEEYLNQLIRKKRIEQIEQNKKKEMIDMYLRYFYLCPVSKNPHILARITTA
jgi:uncharacterized membrane protein